MIDDNIELEQDIDKALDKKKEKKLYLKRLQIKLKNSIESGRLPPDQQYLLIDDTIDRLLLTSDISEEQAKMFFDKIENYLKQLEQLQISISEEYKKAYSRLLEL